MAEQPQEETGAYKVLKMNNGDDVICKIIQEYSDAYIVERPMSIAETPSFNEEMGEVVSQTGLSRWLNFTNDIRFVISKKKIVAVANLAPEVTFFYKHLCSKLGKSEKDQVKTEAEVKDKFKDLKTLAEGMKLEENEHSNVLPFPPVDKSKLH